MDSHEEVILAEECAKVLIMENWKSEKREFWFWLKKKYALKFVKMAKTDHFPYFINVFMHKRVTKLFVALPYISGLPQISEHSLHLWDLYFMS